MKSVRLLLMGFGFLLWLTCNTNYAEYRNQDQIDFQLSVGEPSLLHSLRICRENIKGVPDFSAYEVRNEWRTQPAGKLAEFADLDFRATTWDTVSTDFSWQMNEKARWFHRKISVPNFIGRFKTSGRRLYLNISASIDASVWVDGQLRTDYFPENGGILISESVMPREAFLVTAKVLKGPERGQLQTVKLQLAEVQQAQIRLTRLKVELSALAAALQKLPDIQPEWINQINRCIANLREVTQQSDISQINRILNQVSQQIQSIRDDHSEYPAFVVEPYVLRTSADKVTVAWETDIPADAEVRWGFSAEYSEKLINDFPETMHRATIPGLSQGNAVHYRVRSGRLWSPDYVLHTAPPADSSFRVAIWSGTNSAVHLRKAFAQILLDRNVSLLAQVGECPPEKADKLTWQESYFAPIQNFAASYPAYLAPENTQRQLYQRYAGQHEADSYFAVSHGIVRFIFLDPQRKAPYLPLQLSPGSAQYEWLMDELNSPEFQAATWHFVLLHPSKFVQIPSGDYIDGRFEIESVILPLFDDFSIDAFFWGNQFGYHIGNMSTTAQAAKKNGITADVNQNSCSQGEREFEFYLLEIYRDNLIFQDLNFAGEVRHECQMKRAHRFSE